MRIDIAELTYDEMRDVMQKLRELKMETKVKKLGASFVLQTENGPMQVPRNEAVALLGVPAMF